MSGFFHPGHGRCCFHRQRVCEGLADIRHVDRIVHTGAARAGLVTGSLCLVSIIGAGTLILGSGMLQEHLIRSTETVRRQADELSRANERLSEEMQQRSAVEEKLRQSEFQFKTLFEVAPDAMYLNDTVESVLNMLRRRIGEDIDLIWKPSAHIWPVKMGPSQIDQILANLCVNARDAFPGWAKALVLGLLQYTAS